MICELQMRINANWWGTEIFNIQFILHFSGKKLKILEIFMLKNKDNETCKLKTVIRQFELTQQLTKEINYNISEPIF